jgi:uncharacterized membrane protein (UPF0127 family)
MRRIVRGILPVLVAVCTWSLLVAVSAEDGQHAPAVSQRQRTGTPAANYATAVIGRDIFRLELAVTSEQRERGLMNRDDIASEGGMLFVFPKAEVRSFWMAHTLIDLDIIFLDAQGRITAVHEMSTEPAQAAFESDEAYHARLPLYSSKTAAQFVIELRAGAVDRTALKVGDPVPIAGMEALVRLAKPGTH